MYIKSGFPGGGCQAYIGLHLATGHLGHCGLVYGVFLKALAAQGAGLAVPDSLRAAAGLYMEKER